MSWLGAHELLEGRIDGGGGEATAAEHGRAPPVGLNLKLEDNMLEEDNRYGWKREGYNGKLKTANFTILTDKLYLTFDGSGISLRETIETVCYVGSLVIASVILELLVVVLCLSSLFSRRVHISQRQNNYLSIPFLQGYSLVLYLPVNLVHSKAG